MTKQDWLELAQAVWSAVLTIWSFIIHRNQKAS